MKTILITLIFSFFAVYIARTLNFLQYDPSRLKAFVSLAFVSILLISQPQLSLYLVIGSVTFYDPRYWWTFIRLWLHQGIILLSIILYIGIYLYRRKRFRFNLLDLWLGMLLATFFVSCINSSDLSLSLKWTTYYLVFLGGYLLIRFSVDDEKQLMRIIGFLILCGMASALVSFFRPTVGERVGSLVLVNPNSLGNYLALILPLTLAFLFFGELTPMKNIALLMATVPLICSLILTLSRSSWLGCVVGLLALGCLKPKLKYFLLIMPALVLVLLLPPVQKRLFEDKDDPGVTYRQVKIKIAYQMFKAQPILGHGPGGFQSLAPEMDEWAAYAHSALENTYMRMLAEGGALQILVFICLVVYANHLGVATMKKLPPGLLQTAVVGSLASFWAGLGIGLGEDVLLFPMTNWLFGFYLGVIVKARELHAPTPGTVHETPAFKKAG